MYGLRPAEKWPWKDIIEISLPSNRRLTHFAWIKPRGKKLERVIGVHRCRSQTRKKQRTSTKLVQRTKYHRWYLITRKVLSAADKDRKPTNLNIRTWHSHHCNRTTCTHIYNQSFQFFSISIFFEFVERSLEINSRTLSEKSNRVF